jgi:hypothetical protein
MAEARQLRPNRSTSTHCARSGQASNKLRAEILSDPEACQTGVEGYGVTLMDAPEVHFPKGFKGRFAHRWFTKI